MKNLLNWLLDRLAEQSTWKAIVGAAAAAGATWASDPVKSMQIIAAGMAVIAAINFFRNEKKATTDTTTATVTKTIVPLLLILCLFTGCARFILPSAAQMNALAHDTNAVHLSIQTIYGSVVMDRNYRQIP